MFWQDRKNIHRYTLMEEHIIHVRAVLEALRQHGLTTKPSKCVWGAKTLEYWLGMARLLFLKPELSYQEHQETRKEKGYESLSQYNGVLQTIPSTLWRTVLQFDKSNQERCST